VSAQTPKVRLRLFWQAVKAARGKADDAELRRQFMARARSSGLVAAVHALNRHGEEDVMHGIFNGLILIPGSGMELRSWLSRIGQRMPCREGTAERIFVGLFVHKGLGVRSRLPPKR
jgi:hypothetical protein